MKIEEVRRITGFLLLVVLLLLNGCNAAHDRADAQALAKNIHEQMRAGDYKSVYEGSDPTFQKVGTESEFVKTMKALSEEYGNLKVVTEVAYEMRVESGSGRTHVLVFDLEFDNTKAREEMGFTRSNDGRLQLSELTFEPAN